MNKSKRIKKVAAETGTHDKSKDRVVSSKVLRIISIIFVVVLVGALLFDQLYESTLLRVDGKKYHLKDLSYYFYTVESQYDYLDQMFGGNGAYWNMAADESGATIRDMAKEEVINSAIASEVLYNEAVSQGYSLTDEEKTNVNNTVESMMKDSLTEAVIAKNKFTKEYLTDMLGKSALISRFRQDRIDELDIDDEGIKAGISYDEYRQYDVEYLFVSKKTVNENNEAADKTQEQITADLQLLDTYLEKAKTAEDWSDLLPEEEKTVTYRSTDFIESKSIFDEDLTAKVIAMENNTISEVQETDTGYYVVRMINNNSSESYDNAVSDAITSAESKGFDELYQEILKKHEYKVNEGALRSLTMGSITL
ncbi:foldase protein PrsA [Anaerotaenia torta]|uniref:peptidylprolyl isomerase n=1 Tax=Anaerotaenia torta TaxID=433293 RepID=UPI003D207170